MQGVLKVLKKKLTFCCLTWVFFTDIQTVYDYDLRKELLNRVTSIGHVTVDQLVHQIVIVLSGGPLMVVKVGWDVVRGQLFEDLLLQGGLCVVAVSTASTATVQNLNAITQVLTVGHAVVVYMVTIERECIHNTGVSGIIQDALCGKNHTTKQNLAKLTAEQIFSKERFS